MAKKHRIDGDLLFDTLGQRHACWKDQEEKARKRAAELATSGKIIDLKMQLEEVERCRDRAAECAFIMAIVDDFCDGWRERLKREKQEKAQ